MIESSESAQKPTMLTGREGTLRYLVVDEIQRGGMGAVHRALDWPTRRIVAVKVVKSAADNDRIAARFDREAGLMRRVNEAQEAAGCEAIVKLLDHGAGVEGSESELVGPNDRFLVLEHVDGVSLRSVLDRRTAQLAGRKAEGSFMSWEMIRAVCAGILTALKTTHDVGVIHRDVTPSNILVFRRWPDAPPVAKLADFGIAYDARNPDRSDQRATEPGIVAVTPQYLTPELMRGASPLYESDVFQFALVVYEMITGLPLIPSHMIGRRDLCERLITQPLPQKLYPSALVEGVNPDLEAFCLAGLAPNPEDRPTAVKMLERLDRLFERLEFTEGDARNSVVNSLRASEITFVVPEEPTVLAEDDQTIEPTKPPEPDPDAESARATLYDLERKGTTRFALLFAACLVILLVVIWGVRSIHSKQSATDILASPSASASNATSASAGTAKASSPKAIASAMASTSPVPSSAPVATPTETAVASAAPAPPAPTPVATTMQPVAGVPVDVQAAWDEVKALPLGSACSESLMSRVKQLVSQYPQSPQAFRLLAVCYQRDGKDALALDAMERYQFLQASSK